MAHSEIIDIESNGAPVPDFTLKTSWPAGLLEQDSRGTLFWAVKIKRGISVERRVIF